MDCDLVNSNVSVCCAGIDSVNSLKQEHNLVFDLVEGLCRCFTAGSKGARSFC